jgi:hypothetical protein
MKAMQAERGSLLAGTMLLQEGLLMPKSVDMETDAYSQGWRSVRALDSFSLRSKLAAVGLHLFFIAGHVTTIAFGRGGEDSLRRAVKRIVGQVRELNFNCFELAGILKKHFLGLPYVLVTAHSFHIQEGWQIQDAEVRRRLQCETEWASGGDDSRAHSLWSGQSRW